MMAEQGTRDFSQRHFAAYMRALREGKPAPDKEQLGRNPHPYVCEFDRAVIRQLDRLVRGESYAALPAPEGKIDYAESQELSWPRLGVVYAYGNAREVISKKFGPGRGRVGVVLGLVEAEPPIFRGAVLANFQVADELRLKMLGRRVVCRHVEYVPRVNTGGAWARLTYAVEKFPGAQFTVPVY